MPAFMIVHMVITDVTWIKPYFAEVPKILAEYGGVSIAGARDIKRIEGDLASPDRIAIFSFPSLEAIDRFMTDERYQVFRRLREAGASSQIFVFENAVSAGDLV